MKTDHIPFLICIDDSIPSSMPQRETGKTGMPVKANMHTKTGRIGETSKTGKTVERGTASGDGRSRRDQGERVGGGTQRPAKKAVAA